MARTHAFGRWLYRDKRPNRVARFLNDVLARLANAGVGPQGLATLQVTGRQSGRIVSLPVVVTDVDGERYLVSMLGDNVNWVRNVRAAQGRAALRRGGREDILLEEIAPADRAKILRRYLERAPGARPHIPVDRHASLEDFERITSRYPVFRVNVRAPGTANE